MSRACRRWIASWWLWIGISSRCAPRWRSARRWATALPASPWSGPPGAARAPRRARPSVRMRPWTAADALPARRAGTNDATRFLLDESGPLAVSVRLLGGLEAHHSAWQAAWPWLLVWRLSLYAALVLVWWRKVRPRAVARLRRDRDDGQQALAKLRRLELMALGILVLLEATNLINQLGGA